MVGQSVLRILKSEVKGRIAAGPEKTWDEVLKKDFRNNRFDRHVNKTMQLGKLQSCDKG